jgi:hypothetical protein
MLNRSSFESNQQDETNNNTQQENGAIQNSIEFTDLPLVMLPAIDEHLSGKDEARLASVDRKFNQFFQHLVGKKEAPEAAEYAINPTKENVEKLTALLKACPQLLMHPVTVKNRHGMTIKGTVFQIALHECDNELIADVIKPAFEKLHHGIDTMEAQRKAWFPEGWLESEEKASADALTAIDNTFIEFKKASNPQEVTESPQHPYTITINHQGASEALNIFRQAIDALYGPTDKVIQSGRDPSTCLFQRVINRYEENFKDLGDFNTPRNNALMRSVYGYCQRFAPINFMQAFAQGIYYIVANRKKLTRTLEFSNWSGHSILPVDSDANFRLGFEYFGWSLGWGGRDGVSVGLGAGGLLQNFFSIKNSSSSTDLRYAMPNPS